MVIPQDFKLGDSKTKKIDDILAFLRTKFPEDTEESNPPTWSQAAPAVDSNTGKWRWQTESSLLDRRNLLHMLSSLTEEEKAQVLEDTGILEPPVANPETT